MEPLTVLLQYLVLVLLTVLKCGQFHYDYDSLAKSTKAPSHYNQYFKRLQYCFANC